MPTALVTGASKGIGRAIVDTLLSQGWKVYGISRSDPLLQHPNFEWISFDLMNLNDYQQIADHLPAELDLLINNAGIAYKVSLENLLTLDLEKQFTINVKAPIWLIKTLLPKLQRGKIINIASLAAKMPYPGLAIYSATKAALCAFGEGFAMEVPIPIATLLPGRVDTPILRTILGPDQDYSRFLQPQDIAKAIWKILSDGIHSGQEIAVINEYTKMDAEGSGERLRIINIDQS